MKNIVSYIQLQIEGKAAYMPIHSTRSDTNWFHVHPTHHRETRDYRPREERCASSKDFHKVPLREYGPPSCCVLLRAFPLLACGAGSAGALVAWIILFISGEGEKRSIWVLSSLEITKLWACPWIVTWLPRQSRSFPAPRLQDNRLQLVTQRPRPSRLLKVRSGPPHKASRQGQGR